MYTKINDHETQTCCGGTGKDLSPIVNVICGKAVTLLQSINDCPTGFGSFSQSFYRRKIGTKIKLVSVKLETWSDQNIDSTLCIVNKTISIIYCKSLETTSSTYFNTFSFRLLCLSWTWIHKTIMLQKVQKGLSLIGDPSQLSLCTTVSIISLQVKKKRLLLRELKHRNVSQKNQD